MTKDRYPELGRKIREAIDDTRKQEALYTCMKRGRDTRAEAIAVLEGGLEFRREARQTKERCLQEQDALLERFVANAEKRGTKVFQAKDAAAAIQYVLDVARARGAEIIAKSKSLTTEEIEINEPLIEAGLRVVETDLGELIIQLVGEKPYHLVFPSVHKTAEDVAAIFQKETGEPVSSDIQSIMPVVRKYLRTIFLNTDIGMTGANIGVAETGGIVIETNEGNARLVSSIGDCHIAIMGVEKIVDTVEDALLMVLAHPVSATGQCPTTYVTWLHGRSPLGTEEDSSRESHFVILDNGRSLMRRDPGLKQALHCIRCGACMNVCPTYGVVGGHTFGHIYPGPIGIPWTAQVHGLESAGDFAPLCISCGLCKEICPVDIDIPMMIAEVKDRDAVHHRHPRANKVMMGAERLAVLGSATAPFSNWFLKNAWFRAFLENVSGLDRRRRLPTFSPMYATRRFRSLMDREAAYAAHHVAFFADVFAHYNDAEFGTAVVEHLQGCGCQVKFPKQKPSGYPFIAYGDMDRARRRAKYNVASLAAMVRKGYEIVTSEPTAAYALKKSYPSLLDETEDAAIVSKNTYGLFEYLLKIESEADDRLWKGRRFGFHWPCHQRAQETDSAAVEWLRRRGAEVEIIETGTCCGMGGTFGLKTGPVGYELSQAVGKPLFDLFKESGVELIVSESSVCKMQLEEGTEMPVYHPLELIRPAG